MLRRILAIVGLLLFVGTLGLLADYVFRVEGSGRAQDGPGSAEDAPAGLPREPGS